MTVYKISSKKSLKVKKKNKSTDIKIFDIISKDFKSKSTYAFIFFFLVIIIFAVPLRIHHNAADVNSQVLLPTNIHFQSYHKFYQKHFNINIYNFDNNQNPSFIFKNILINNFKQSKIPQFRNKIVHFNEENFILNFKIRVDLKKNKVSDIKSSINEGIRSVLRKTIIDFNYYFIGMDFVNDDLILKKNLKEAELSLLDIYNNGNVRLEIQKSKLKILEYFILILLSFVLFFIIFLLINSKLFQKIKKNEN